MLFLTSPAIPAAERLDGIPCYVALTGPDNVETVHEYVYSDATKQCQWTVPNELAITNSTDTSFVPATQGAWLNVTD